MPVKGLVALSLLIVVAAAAALGAVNVMRSPTTTQFVTTTSSVPPPTTTTTVEQNVTISAVGDTELGNTPQLPPDPSTYLSSVKAALASPIVFGNLEGVMTDASTSKCATTALECYAFHIPPSYAAIYRAAGFTVLNSANNHSHDFGASGAIDTSTALRSAGITQAGQPGQIGVVREGLTKVAFVDFAPYYNTNNLLDFPVAAQLIAQAKKLANIVVVYMHAGAEGTAADHVTRASETYFGENRGNPYAFAHAAIVDGADLVIASGPHVLRGLEWFRGHLIAYSLGDFANYYDFATAGTLDLSVILHVTLTPSGSFVAGRVTSLVLSASGQPSVDPAHAAADFVNQLSRADFGAHAALINGAGALIAPVG